MKLDTGNAFTLACLYCTVSTAPGNHFMHTSLAESRDHLLQAIDGEIISLEESTRALRSRRNALAPISRLPLETLAAVFFFLSPPATFFTSFHFVSLQQIWLLQRLRPFGMDACRSCLSTMARDRTQQPPPLESHQLHHKHRQADASCHG